MKLQYIFIGAILLIVVFIAGCSATGRTVAESAEGYVSIPVSEVSTQVGFYSLENSGVKINYFAVLGSDGKPRTAFDACDVCGGYKGYQQQGSDIKCGKCGRVFSIDGLGTKNKGYGCWPSYLPHEVRGDDILIKISDIKDGRKRFA